MNESILVSFGGYGVFLILGAVLITIPIVAGMFVRPFVQSAQKRTVYECGEPTIGSSWIRYNIRFYSTALDFLIFDVEVVLLLPASVALIRIGQTIGKDAAWAAFVAIGLFVVVLGLGLAYAWRWGSVDWIRGGQTDQTLASWAKRSPVAPAAVDTEREAA